MTDVIVVGGGPAGLTAGLYLARAGRSVLVLEESTPGGQINFSPLVENYPGLPRVAGSELGDTLAEQAQDLGAQLEYESVTAVTPLEEGFQVDTDCGSHTCKGLILATGVRHRPLGLPGEEDLVGQGISYCAVCDGPFCKGKPVAVVGGGDTALQDALFLAQLCPQVTLIHRRDQFRGAQRLVDQVLTCPNIQCLMDSTVEVLDQADGQLTGIQVKNKVTGETAALAVDNLFVAVGQQPQNERFADLVKLDEAGYIRSSDCRTSRPGVYAAGDCRTKSVRQLTTAVSDGTVAALLFLEET